MGVRCVGAPIRNVSGRVFAAISVSGPARRMTKAKVASLSRLVVQYADAISAQLGFHPAQTHRSRRATRRAVEADNAMGAPRQAVPAGL